MNKSKKITLIISIALVSIILLIGVTYALNYTQTGTNQQLLLGDIWMKYEEVNGLTISDAVPGSNYSNYFEFTISGTNTYTKKDIYYDFLLVKGDLPTGKTESNRIPDEYLKFKLVSVDSSNQETEIFTDKTYPSLENTRIYVETIGAGVTNYSKTYRLYMTIDNSLLIGNSSDAVFTFSEWESAFASIKVDVTGNFLEKKILTYNDCFETSVLSDGTLEITDYYKYGKYNYNTSTYNENSLCTSDVVIPSEIDGVSVTVIGSFAYKELTSVVIPNNVVEIGAYAFNDNQLTNIIIPDGVVEIGAYAFNNNQLTNIIIPDSVVEIGAYAFNNNQLTNIIIPDSVIHIGEAAFNDNKFLNSDAYIYARTDENGDGVAEIDTTTIVSYAGESTQLVIPNGVITIGESAFKGNKEFNISEISFPNSLKIIEDYAFYGSLDLDFKGTYELSSVEVLGYGALSPSGSKGEFNWSFPNLRILSAYSLSSHNITIGNLIERIDRGALDLCGVSQKIKINKTCEEIRNIPGLDGNNEYETEEKLYYPWFAYDEPYYSPDSQYTGTIYGLNDEVCGTYQVRDCS